MAKKLIKRADGSYSQRGLWDNIRANKGSGKKPTKEMLAQEKKIKKKMELGGTITNDMKNNKLPKMWAGGLTPMLFDVASNALVNLSTKAVTDMVKAIREPEQERRPTKPNTGFMMAYGGMIDPSMYMQQMMYGSYAMGGQIDPVDPKEENKIMQKQIKSILSGKPLNTGITMTKLSPDEEYTYQQWAKGLTPNLQGSMNDKNYDMRGAWQVGEQPELFYNDEQGNFQSAHPIDVNQQGSIYEPHLFSRNPFTGKSLKGPNHPSFMHALEGDIKSGGKVKIDLKTADMYTYAQGGQVPQNIPVEVEGQEMYEMPNGQTGEFKGPKHENGGIPVALPEGTKVYSDRLKVNGKTMADRKDKRERNIAKLEKLLGKTPHDKFLRQSLERQKETAALEEQSDMAMQEQANQQQAQQEQAMMQEQMMAGLMQDPAMMQQMGMMMYGGKLANGSPGTCPEGQYWNGVECVDIPNSFSASKTIESVPNTRFQKRNNKWKGITIVDDNSQIPPSNTPNHWYDQNGEVRTRYNMIDGRPLSDEEQTNRAFDEIGNVETNPEIISKLNNKLKNEAQYYEGLTAMQPMLQLMNPFSNKNNNQNFEQNYNPSPTVNDFGKGAAKKGINAVANKMKGLNTSKNNTLPLSPTYTEGKSKLNVSNLNVPIGNIKTNPFPPYNPFTPEEWKTMTNTEFIEGEGYPLTGHNINSSFTNPDELNKFYDAKLKDVNTLSRKSSLVPTVKNNYLEEMADLAQRASGSRGTSFTYYPNDYDGRDKQYPSVVTFGGKSMTSNTNKAKPITTSNSKPEVTDTNPPYLTEEQLNQFTNFNINPLDFRENVGVNSTSSPVMNTITTENLANPFTPTYTAPQTGAYPKIKEPVTAQLPTYPLAMGVDPIADQLQQLMMNGLPDQMAGKYPLNPKKPNKFMNFLNKAVDETGDFFSGMFDKNGKPKKEKGTKSDKTKSGEGLDYTRGDLMGMAGTLFGGLAPMTTTMMNRMMTPKNQNFFREYGAEGLRAMQEAQALSSINRDKQLADIKLGEEASRQRGRNSARGVNTLRALDIAADMGANQAQNQAYNSYAQQMMQLLGQKAQMENQQDQMVMKGEYDRDLADRQDVDNFYTNLAENFASQSELMQKQGKDMNQAKYNKQVMNLLPYLSRYGIGVEFDENDNVVTYDLKTRARLSQEETTKRLKSKTTKEETPKEKAPKEEGK